MSNGRIAIKSIQNQPLEHSQMSHLWTESSGVSSDCGPRVACAAVRIFWCAVWWESVVSLSASLKYLPRIDSDNKLVLLDQHPLLLVAEHEEELYYHIADEKEINDSVDEEQRIH